MRKIFYLAPPNRGYLLKCPKTLVDDKGCVIAISATLQLFYGPMITEEHVLRYFEENNKSDIEFERKHHPHKFSIEVGEVDQGELMNRFVHSNGFTLIFPS